jgi:hypothetical protein
MFLQRWLKEISATLMSYLKIISADLQIEAYIFFIIHIYYAAGRFFKRLTSWIPHEPIFGDSGVLAGVIIS